MDEYLLSFLTNQSGRKVIFSCWVYAKMILLVQAHQEKRVVSQRIIPVCFAFCHFLTFFKVFYFLFSFSFIFIFDRKSSIRFWTIVNNEQLLLLP